jgi:hypothetical protein
MQHIKHVCLFVCLLLSHIIFKVTEDSQSEPFILPEDGSSTDFRNVAILQLYCRENLITREAATDVNELCE